MSGVIKDAEGNVLDPLPVVVKRIERDLSVGEDCRLRARRDLAACKVRVQGGEAGEVTWTGWLVQSFPERSPKYLANEANKAPGGQAQIEADRERVRGAVQSHREGSYVTTISQSSDVDPRPYHDCPHCNGTGRIYE